MFPIILIILIYLIYVAVSLRLLYYISKSELFMMLIRGKTFEISMNLLYFSHQLTWLQNKWNSISLPWHVEMLDQFFTQVAWYSSNFTFNVCFEVVKLLLTLYMVKRLQFLYFVSNVDQDPFAKFAIVTSQWKRLMWVLLKWSERAVNI